MSSLSNAGIEVEGVKRGLDHGVWASFKCGKCSHYVAKASALHFS